MQELERIASGVWGYQHVVSLPLAMTLPARATVLRLSTGELVVYSPLPIDDEMARELDALGDVRYLVAPSLFHWMFLSDAKRRYPKARTFGPERLDRKLGARSDLDLELLPIDGALPGTKGEVHVSLVAGVPSLREHVLLHESSRTLVVADLMFNLRVCDSLLMRSFLRITGSWDKPAQSVEWRLLTRDRLAAANATERILGLDYERVVVAHGDVMEDDARELARRALRWMTEAAPASSRV